MANPENFDEVYTTAFWYAKGRRDADKRYKHVEPALFAHSYREAVKAWENNPRSSNAKWQGLDRWFETYAEFATV